MPWLHKNEKSGRKVMKDGQDKVEPCDMLTECHWKYYRWCTHMSHGHWTVRNKYERDGECGVARRTSLVGARAPGIKHPV